MRESIGATWIFSICITFIILFTAYLAISVNYAKAFRIKSYIVTQIEENEGYNGGRNGALKDSIQKYLSSQGYSAYGSCPDTYEAPNHPELDTSWRLASNGCLDRTSSGMCSACIYELSVTNVGNDAIECPKSYYRVVTFFKFDLPVVNTLTTFPVSGESRLVYDYQNC